MDGIPIKLKYAAAVLAAELERADWPELIGRIFEEGISTPTAMQNLLLRGNMTDISLKDSVLILFWFFRGLQYCNRNGRQFIDRVMDAGNCKSFYIYIYLLHFCSIFMYFQ